jgi:hypothetical protein
MGKYSKFFRQYYKCPKTRNEARQNQEGWCRAKRRPANLPDLYDDRPRCYQNNWKIKRKTKYRIGKRGKKHTIFCKRFWVLERYCEKHDIPYNIEKVSESYTYTVPVWKKEFLYRKPNYVLKSVWEKDTNGKYVLVRRVVHMSGYKDVYKWVKEGKQTKRGRRLLGYNFTWWSDKDIGIEYIIKDNN